MSSHLAVKEVTSSLVIVTVGLNKDSVKLTKSHSLENKKNMYYATELIQ